MFNHSHRWPRNTAPTITDGERIKAEKAQARRDARLVLRGIYGPPIWELAAGVVIGLSAGAFIIYFVARATGGL